MGGRTQKTEIVIVTLLVLILAGGSVTLYAALSQKPQLAVKLPAFVKATPKPAEPPKFYSPLTGLQVPDMATTKRQVTGIDRK